MPAFNHARDCGVDVRTKSRIQNVQAIKIRKYANWDSLWPSVSNC
jgi:hypothetical protein